MNCVRCQRECARRFRSQTMPRICQPCFTAFLNHASELSFEESLGFMDGNSLAATPRLMVAFDRWAEAGFPIVHPMGYGPQPREPLFARSED